MRSLVSIFLIFLVHGTLCGQTYISQIDKLLDSTNIAIKSDELDKTQDHLDLIFNLYDVHQLVKDDRLVKAILFQSQLLINDGKSLESLEILSQADSIYQLDSCLDILMVAQLQLQQGVSHYYLGAYEKALPLCEQAYASAMSRAGTDDWLVFRTLNFVSVIHFVLYHTEKSLSISEDLLKRVEAVDPPDEYMIEQVLNNLAISYSQLRQYDKAKSYLQRCFDMRSSRAGLDSKDLHWTNFNLGHVAQEMQNFPEAIKYYKETDRLREMYMPGDPLVAENYRRLGQCYQELEEYDTTTAYYDKAETIYLNHGQMNHNLAQVYNSYAELYRHLQIYDTALLFSQKSLELTRQTLGETHPWLSTNLRNQAFYFVKLGDYLKAKKCIQEALNLLEYHSEIYDAGALSAKDHVYRALDMAGFIYLNHYYVTHDTSQLTQAASYYFHAIGMLDILRRDLWDENSKILFSAESMETYKNAIEVAYHQYQESSNTDYIESALTLSELSRRSTVLQSIVSSDADRFPGIPPDLIKKEKAFLRNISRMDEDLIEKKFAGQPNIEEQNVLRERIFYEQQLFFEFIDSMQADYPVYFQTRYVSEVPNIEIIQSKLDAHQGVIEYFDGGEFIYVFLITKRKVQMSRMIVDDVLMTSLHQYTEHLSNPDSILLDPISSQQKFSSASHQLYGLLVDTLLDNAGLKEILIIPDGSLTKVVFEVLLTQEPDNSDVQTWSFLMQDYTISYAQSILTWDSQNQKKPKATKLFAGFAPSYEAFDLQALQSTDQPLFAMLVRAGESNLPGAKKELQDIAQIMVGNLFFDQAATERNFVEQIEPYRILHVSAHAIMDEKSPAHSRFILTPSKDSLYDDELTALEICHLDLSAQLAVLSACHTGTGLVNRGEGIMSLGRAFAFAGVPSTVQSMWRVPDETTARLMPFFYTSLKNGMRKNEALNNARLEYLKQTNIAIQRHPYFWAGFVLYGNSDAIDFESDHFGYKWLILLGVLLLGGVLVKLSW